MKRELTCIVCPRGCLLTVDYEGKTINSVSGNICPRGKTYAENECINPMRTLTTTMRCNDGSVVSVRTNGTVPKDKLFECMEIVNSKVVQLPVSVGEVVIEDLFGCSVIATQTKNNYNIC